MKAGRLNRESAAASKAGTTGGTWRDSFGLFGRRGEAVPEQPGEDRRIGRLERAALADLDLEPGVEKKAIKARYHELLKRFHPDHNKGDRGAEAKLQRVIKAWKTLQKAGLA
jgi:DnaJ-domain-containing protein 1